MGIVFNTTDHEVRQMTKLMSKNIDQSLLVIDDFLSQFDAGEVSESLFHRPVWKLHSCGFSSPVCATGCGVQLLAPDDFHAPSRRREVCDLAICNGGVQFMQKGLCDLLFRCFEGLLGMKCFFGLFDRTLCFTRRCGR